MICDTCHITYNIMYICNISGLDIILMDLVFAIYLQFFCHLLLYCLISLKSPSKDITGTHWSRASTSKRRNMMVCNKEKWVLCIHYWFSVSWKFESEVQFSKDWHLPNFVSKTLLQYFLFYFPLKTFRQVSLRVKFFFF
jgi:hypothetical protein